MVKSESLDTIEVSKSSVGFSPQRSQLSQDEMRCQPGGAPVRAITSRTVVVLYNRKRVINFNSRGGGGGGGGGGGAAEGRGERQDVRAPKE